MKNTPYDYLIVGAGPAGLQLGAHLQAEERSYIILESGETAGTFFKQYPRHRKLISINKKYTGETHPERNLRMDWNSILSNNPNLLFTKYTEKYFPPADTFVHYLQDYAQKQNLNIAFNTQVMHVEKKDGIFHIDTNQKSFSCKALIIATGVSKENIPAIPGIELVEKYSETNIDPKDYTNQKVLILGKGNSAFETADNLIETTAAVHVAGPSSVKLAWQTHFVGHLRAVNNNILDTYQLKSQNAILDGNVVSIEKENGKFKVVFSFVRSDEVRKTLVYDRVICCTGFKFNSDIFADNTKPTLTINNRFPELTSGWESSNISNLFFAGTLMQQRDYKKSTCGFVHGFRYSVRSLFHILNQRFEKQAFPHTDMPTEALPLAEFIVERVNTTSALWQQFEFMSDALLFNGKTSTYVTELPSAFVHDTFKGMYMVITLEYGPDHAKVDPFDVTVQRVAQDDHEMALNAQYLHPVLRTYRDNTFISEHHMAENLENEWNGHESHLLPLARYLQTCIDELHSTDNTKAMHAETQDA